MPRSGDDDPKGLQRTLGLPSGAAAAQDVLHDAFQGLTPEQSAAAREAILDAMQGQSWSVTGITERLEPIWRDAGFPPQQAKNRARLAARTESAALVSEYKRARFEATEAERGPGVYRMAGARDFRRTKLSYWVDQEVGAGKSLADVEAILDRGLELAKQGAFGKGGALANTPGQPIVLPAGFSRRGFVIHFNDRDDVVRVR